MSRELTLRCEDSLDGIFTAIYDAFVYKNQMERPYTDSIRIAIGEGNLTLFSMDLTVATDSIKVEKTVQTIQKRLGYSVYETLLEALCHYDEERASVVLGYLVRAFGSGHSIEGHLSDPYVMSVMQLARKVNHEIDKFNGFLRFEAIPNMGYEQMDAIMENEENLQGQGYGEVLLAQVEPKCNLVPLMMEHFADRFPNENFIIYDNNRRLAAVHERYKSCVLVEGQELEIPDRQSDYFTELWKQYFHTMEIKPRHNEHCQNTLMPKWYRKHMPEIQN